MKIDRLPLVERPDAQTRFFGVLLRGEVERFGDLQQGTVYWHVGWKNAALRAQAQTMLLRSGPGTGTRVLQPWQLAGDTIRRGRASAIQVTLADSLWNPSITVYTSYLLISLVALPLVHCDEATLPR
jgi:hypothetical protein